MSSATANSPSARKLTGVKASGKQSARDAALKTVGPDSLMWKFFGDSRLMFFIGQAFVLQVAHPVIDSAVETQSTYKEDPWGRASRSFKYLWPVVYNRPEKAIAAGKFLREWHRDVKGVDKHGKKYFAFDPEAYAWVHITAYDAMVRQARLMGKPLNEQQLNQLYEEWKAVGLLLGCREQDMPATKEEYWPYFENMIKDKLEYTESVKYWLSGDFVSNVEPPSKAIPRWAWKALLKPAGWGLDLTIRGGLPDVFREKFDIPLSSTEKRMYHGLAKAANLVWPVLPLRLKYVPHAWQGVRDARRHPEAYPREKLVS